MVSPLSSTVVIECPQCGTRYQLPPEAIGPKGRKVACAHCGSTWQAKAIRPEKAAADSDTMFGPKEEAALDAAFAAEEEEVAAAVAEATEAVQDAAIPDIRAAIAPRPQKKPAGPARADPGDKKRQKDFRKRQAAFSKKLPLARVRRAVRAIAIVTFLSLIIGGIAFRTEIVKRVPDLAGAYEAFGLGVNVIGLEFRDVTTIATLRNGTNVMQIDARIYSVAPRSVAVPPVVITLLDDSGASVYEWSVVPQARDLEPGEVVDFAAQLSSPPAAAKRVRLTFTDGRARVESPVSSAAATSE
jgi:predicted Zn finger-like uncharacterized protein